MYIGSLTKKYIEGFEYYRRGTDIPLPPDLINDGTKAGWSQMTVLNVGIDIDVKLKHKCYIDTVIIDGQGVSSAQAYSNNKCIGKGNGNKLVIGENCESLTITLNADYMNIIINSIDITGAVIDDILIYPQCANAKFNGKGPYINTLTAILTDTTDSDCVFASEHLAEKLNEKFGITLPIKPYGKKSENAVHVLKAQGIKPEGYSLITDDNSCTLSASSRLGLVYGTETLTQTVSDGSLMKCVIDDSPYMEFRGAHFGLPERGQIDFFKRLIKYVLVPMKYNTIFIEVAGGMEFESHPEINAGWVQKSLDAKNGLCPPPPHSDMVAGGSVLTKAEVADIVEYAESFGIEVIPEIQSLSHVQYIVISHPEIAEIPASLIKEDEKDEFEADKLPPEEYPSCYCPSNEKSYEIIFDLMDEIIKVFKPKRYVHMGHDEVYRIGVCPVCRDKDPAELYARDVNRLHDKLAEYGLKMMIWSDMLQDCTAYKTPPAIDKIPKDIVMLDFIWYFHFDKDIEDRLLDNRFNIIMGNMYSSHYPRYASRAEKPCMIGAQVSTWVRTEEYRLAYEGKIYDFIYSAGMMWTRGYNENCRRCYSKIVQDIIPELRYRLNGKSPVIFSREKSYTGSDICYEIHGPHSKYGSNTETSFRISGKHDAIEFTHAASSNAERIAWAKLVVIGEYEVSFSDGTSEFIPVEYGGNICDIHRRYGEPMPQAYYRHEGYIGTYISDPVNLKDSDGSTVTLYKYLWHNPSPDKSIEKIILRGKGNTDSGIILYDIKGLNK